VTKKPPPGQWGPTVQPGGLPRNPRHGEVKAGGDSYWKTRPRGPKKPMVPPPTKGPKPPKPPGRSGCSLLFWLAVILVVIILVAKARQGH
jgi:hypothetical protein